MDGTAVKELERITRESMLVDVGGKLHSPLNMSRIIDDPRPKPLTVATLTGLVEYVCENVDGYEFEKCLVVVQDHKSVRLVTEVRGERNERHAVVQVELDAVDPFPFGKWLGQEDFNIQLRSRFVDSDDLLEIVTYVSKIDTKTEGQITDDGVVQTAMVRKGVSGAISERGVAPSIVTLRPFRTFPEVEQPASRFLFRMRQQDGIQCALFEADGGAWKNTARESIREWLFIRFNTITAETPAVIA